MKIVDFDSLSEALMETMVEDLDYTLIRHSYPKGTHIIPHVHLKADEYVIAQKGHFLITSEEVTKEFSLDGESVTVIYYPAGREHGLKVLGDRLDYFVLRAPKY